MIKSYQGKHLRKATGAKVDTVIASLIVLGTFLFLGFFMVNDPVRDLPDKRNKQIVSAAMSALDHLPQNPVFYGKTDSFYGWHVIWNDAKITVSAPKQYGDIRVSLLQHRKRGFSLKSLVSADWYEYAPFLITVNGEEAFHVTEDWARSWFFCET